jgi:hypothetical protein
MNWFIGFIMGVLIAAGYNRLADINAEKKQVEEDVAAFGVSEVLSAYKEGRRDALKTNPASFELEQTCLEIWANKQPQ